MLVRDVLHHELFQKAVLRTGTAGLDRKVTWVHVVDQPDPAEWVKQGQLVLTTGHALTGDTARQRAVLHELANVGVAGVVLAVPMYFAAFPSGMVETAIGLNLPLIEIPWKVPFVDLTEALHRVALQEQYQVLEASEQVHRQLTRAAVSFRGLQDLAETLSELLRRAVIVEGVDGSLLAHQRYGREDRVRAVTLATNRGALEYDSYLQALGLVDDIRKADAPLRIPSSPDGRIAARIVCPVQLLKERLGYVWIIEGAEPLSELDLRAAEHAATIAALHISHQREVWHTEHRLGATLLDTLLALEGKPDPGLIEHAHLVGLQDNSPWRIAQVALPYALPLTNEDLRTRDRITARWRNRLLDEGKPALVTTHLQHVISLAHESTDLKRLAQEQQLDIYRILISAPGRRLEDVRAVYLDLQMMDSYVVSAGVHDYTDLLLPRVLGGDHIARRELVNRMIGALDRVRGGDALRETLAMLCLNGFQLKATAAGLGLHVSTLRYRLERLHDVLGHDFANHKTRFMLQLAFEILTYDDTP